MHMGTLVNHRSKVALVGLGRAEDVTEQFLRVFSRVITAGLSVGDLRLEVTFAQVYVLRYLHQYGARTIGQIAEGLGITSPAATKLVDRLVIKRLVARREGRHDRRVTEVRLTARGKRLVERFRARRQERLSRIVSRMSGEQQARFVQGLEAFIAAAAAEVRPARAATSLSRQRSL
ncbi:MAG: MarR family transcriptional regulator [Armatimonadetes bacterium]|nr:MarR family transcriptional regulator [Armatimonadota bacterium]